MKKIYLILLLLPLISFSQSLDNVVFVGGLEKVCSLKRQVELFKLGYGTPVKFISYKWNSPTHEIIKIIKANPSANIILFSAGCQKAKELLLTDGINKRKIYLIEPYGPNESLSWIIDYTKFPTKNIFVGKNKERGYNITKNTTSSGSESHCESLTTSAIIIRLRK